METEAKLAASEAVVADLIAAWEALPGDRNYSVRDAQAWIVDTMKPAIDRARAFRAHP